MKEIGYCAEIEGFELLDRLGDGSMGEVYRAKDCTTGNIVALKLLYPFLAGNITYLQRFQAEAEAARELDHPNLVKVFRSGRSGLSHFICMEYVDGTNLLQMIRNHGAMSQENTAAIGMSVASALQYAWDAKQLIHRDIKPENLVVSRLGVVKVCDLGIAKRLQSGEPALTRTGLAMGSPHYIAPEQARGEKGIDFRVDIYALGATLYHIVTGQTVHQADSEYGLMIKHATEPVKDPRTQAPDLDAAFAELLMRMLDLDRHHRPESWCAVYDELADIYGRVALRVA